MNQLYTTQLQAGLGMIEETKILLSLWEPGMTQTDLYQEALNSGRLPGVSARRLKNIVTECFGPRYLIENGRPANYIKVLNPALSAKDIEQAFLIYTCRANKILFDFILEIFWPTYSSGRESISNNDAREFVIRSNQQGLTKKPWSESTIRRVSAYLTGACADFGLLEGGNRVSRRILPFRIEAKTVIMLAYELHFDGLGDNAIVNHPDWGIWGLDRYEVVSELKRISLQGAILVQTAGETVRIGWRCKNEKELANAIS